MMGVASLAGAITSRTTTTAFFGVIGHRHARRCPVIRREHHVRLRALEPLRRPRRTARRWLGADILDAGDALSTRISVVAAPGGPARRRHRRLRRAVQSAGGHAYWCWSGASMASAPAPAGLGLTATIRRHRPGMVKLISNPEVSDAEKLSWLVLGTGLDDAEGAGQLLVLQAAADSLLGDENSKYADSLTDRIGIDMLSVKEGQAGTGNASGSGGRARDRGHRRQAAVARVVRHLRAEPAWGLEHPQAAVRHHQSIFIERAGRQRQRDRPALVLAVRLIPRFEGESPEPAGRSHSPTTNGAGVDRRRAGRGLAPKVVR